MRLMTIALTASFAMTALGAARAEEQGKSLAMGSKAPMAATKLKSATDGKSVAITDVKGTKGTLVVFTCNHCPYAKAWEQRIVEMGHEYSKKGIGTILLNPNDPGVSKGDSFEAMQERAKERGMQMPYVMDEGSALAKAFGAMVTPEAYLFDKGGKLVYHGTIDDNHKEADKVEKRYLKDALDAVAGGKTVPMAETKGIGCTIKFKKVS